MEKTLNALLEPEADRLCNALRHELSEVRRDTCIGNYDLKLQIKAGEVGLFEPRSVDHLFSRALPQ